MCTHTHSHTCTLRITHARAYTHAHIHTHAHANTHTHACTCTRKNNARMRIHTHTSNRTNANTHTCTQARLEALESTKAVLLDRLEGLTGQPQGGVWDTQPPPTPPDLHLPAPRPPGRGGAHPAGASQQGVTAEMALRSIARVAQTGRPSEWCGRRSWMRTRFLVGVACGLCVLASPVRCGSWGWGAGAFVGGCLSGMGPRVGSLRTGKPCACAEIRRSFARSLAALHGRSCNTGPAGVQPDACSLYAVFGSGGLLVEGPLPACACAEVCTRPCQLMCCIDPMHATPVVSTRSRPELTVARCTRVAAPTVQPPK